MKKIFKTGLVLFGIIATLNVNASNSINTLDLKKVDGKKVRFTLNEMKKVKMSIYDSNDILLFKEDLWGNKVVRTYDLTALPEGDYFMETESDIKISKYKIEVKGAIAKLSSEAISEIFKPVFTYNETTGMVKINFLANNKSSVKIEIYDSNRDLLYSNICTLDKFVKNYDIKAVYGEECSFIVYYDGKVFEKTFLYN